jgi:hypothetical protein
MKSMLAFLFVSAFHVTSLANTPLLLNSTNPGNCRYPNTSCVQLGCFYDHCDFDSDIEKVTQACRGVWDDGCIRTLCNHRGDCSFISKFIKYADLCRQN